jgi:hypothetical protein
MFLPNTLILSAQILTLALLWLRQMGHIARTEETRFPYRILVGNLLEYAHLQDKGDERWSKIVSNGRI